MLSSVPVGEVWWRLSVLGFPIMKGVVNLTITIYVDEEITPHQGARFTFSNKAVARL